MQVLSSLSVACKMACTRNEDGISKNMTNLNGPTRAKSV